MNNDKLIIGGHEFNSRFILGSGKYSMKLIEAAVKDAGAEIITLAVRRANTKEHENILDYIPEGITLLPNTSGARNAEEAVRIARLARELGCGNFVKIEIMRDSKYRRVWTTTCCRTCRLRPEARVGSVWLRPG